MFINRVSFIDICIGGSLDYFEKWISVHEKPETTLHPFFVCFLGLWIGVLAGSDIIINVNAQGKAAEVST